MATAVRESPSPPPVDPNMAPVDDADVDTAPHDDVPDEGEDDQYIEGDTAAEVAKRMAERHREVVKMLSDELLRARKRGTLARDRLSHTLVLLDEAQAALIQVTAERDAFAKSKLDLQGEVSRLQNENHRLSVGLQQAAQELDASRLLAANAYEESGRNRALLQQAIRGSSTADAGASGEAGAAVPPLTPQQRFPPVGPSSPQPDAPQQTVTPDGQAASGYMGAVVDSGAAGKAVDRGSVGTAAASPPVAMPTRPHVAAEADAQLSQNVHLSAEGHVAVATNDTYGSPACVVYMSTLSMRGLDFVSTIRSREAMSVAVGISCAPLTGRPRDAPLQCYVRGDGIVRILCDGSDIETRLSAADPSDVPQLSGAAGASKPVSVRWDPLSRKIIFGLGSGVTGLPIVLPPAFTREAMCPIVWLPQAGDEVVTRRR